MTSYPLFARRSWLLVGCIAIGWATPIILELVGLIESTWSIEPGGMLVKATVLAVHGAMTSALVFATCFFAILIAGFIAGAVATGHLDAKHRLVTQAWQLRQLLPHGATRS